MSDTWTLHPQLHDDCHLLGSIKKCELLLHKNASLPWFLVVPRCGVEDLLKLDPAYRNEILDIAGLAADYIRQHTAFPKINLASIGNLVPQLHVHVVGRNSNDPCWPRPVWGNLNTAKDYSTEEIAQIQSCFEFN